MTKQEIRNAIRKNELEIAKYVDLAKAENRELTTTEDTTVKYLKEDVEDLKRELEQSKEDRSNIVIVNKETRAKGFNFNELLRNIKNGNLNDDQRQASRQTFEKYRNAGLAFEGTPVELRSMEEIRDTTGGLAAGTTGSGKETVQTSKLDLLTPLQNSLIFAKAGAQIIDGLTNNISFVTYSGSTASWKGERATADAGTKGNEFTEKTFSPLRITTKLYVTDLFLMQDSLGAQQKVLNDLIYSIKNKLEATLLGVASGSTTQPAGIFYNASYVATGSTDWAKIVSLETEINQNNANYDTMYYVLHPATLGKLKTTAKAANTAAFIADGGLVNGYKYIMTNNMPTISSGKGVVFGNFSDMVIPIWNTLDIKVDNMTLAEDGVTKFIVSMYVNGGIIRPESFSKAWLS